MCKGSQSGNVFAHLKLSSFRTKYLSDDVKFAFSIPRIFERSIRKRTRFDGSRVFILRRTKPDNMTRSATQLRRIVMLLFMSILDCVCALDSRSISHVRRRCTTIKPRTGLNIPSSSQAHQVRPPSLSQSKQSLQKKAALRATKTLTSRPSDIQEALGHFQEKSALVVPLR